MESEAVKIHFGITLAMSFPMKGWKADILCKAAAAVKSDPVPC